MKKKSDVIKRISLKELWKNDETSRIEEKRMSPFIATEAIDEISRITGYDLEVTNMELFVGDFRADIVCKDINTGDVVVIENQLGDSDHDHIGKAITYLTNLDAKGIIWICEHVRPEHRKAVEKLNEITSDEYNFYFLELIAEQHEKDEPYYNFNEVFIPSNINKLANQLKTKTDEQLTIGAYFEKFIGELSKNVPTAKYNRSKLTYHSIYSKGPLWSHVSLSTKDMNNMRFEIGYDVTNISENDYKDKFESIQNVLNSKYGYNFEFEIGKKNTNLRKIKWSVSFDINNDMTPYKDICCNIYKTILNIWK